MEVGHLMCSPHKITRTIFDPVRHIGWTYLIYTKGTLFSRYSNGLNFGRHLPIECVAESIKP